MHHGEGWLNVNLNDVSIPIPIPIPNSFTCSRAGFEFRKVSMRFAQHPNWEWKLVHRISESAIFVKYSLNCFLRPGTVGSLSWHYQLNSLFNGFRIRIFRIHEGHNCPTRLYDLCILMFHPSTQLTRLVTLPQPPSALCFFKRKSQALRECGLVSYVSPTKDKLSSANWVA